MILEELKQQSKFNLNVNVQTKIKFLNEFRIFWVLVPLICFMCGISLMVTFLMRYKSNPTRINVDSNFGPIRDLTFPAIILCNTNFFTESQANMLIKTL